MAIATLWKGVTFTGLVGSSPTSSAYGKYIASNSLLCFLWHNDENR